MARIGIVRTTPVGKLFGQAINNLTAAQQQLVRVKLIADQISAGGATPTNLETSNDASVDSGQGANFYADVQSIKAAVDGLLTIIAKYDMGQ